MGIGTKLVRERRSNAKTRRRELVSDGDKNQPVTHIKTGQTGNVLEYHPATDMYKVYIESDDLETFWYANDVKFTDTVSKIPKTGYSNTLKRVVEGLYLITENIKLTEHISDDTINLANSFKLDVKDLEVKHNVNLELDYIPIYNILVDYSYGTKTKSEVYSKLSFHGFNIIQKSM